MRNGWVNAWRVGASVTFLAAVLVAGAPAADAAHTAFSSPFTGGTDVATGFAECGATAVGPAGLIDDGTNMFVTDDCNATTYRLPAGGGDVSAPGVPANANGLNIGIAVHRGHYYGASCHVGCPGGTSLVGGLYEFDPSSLAITRTVATGFGDKTLAVADDPVDDAVFVSACDSGSPIVRVDNPSSATPTVSSFGIQPPDASQCFDGLAVTSDGSTLYATDSGTQTIRGYRIATGDEVSAVSVAGHDPDGIAVVRAGTVMNGVDFSNNVFVNSNDGTIERIDTNSPGDPVTVVASGGSRGDFAAVDPSGCLFVTQSATVEKLTPCIFQTTLPPPTRPSTHRR
jgi:hypothetical protein